TPVFPAIRAADMGVVAYRCTASAYFSTNSGEGACTVPRPVISPFRCRRRAFLRILMRRFTRSLW
ncbi:hypothetical protein ABJB44_11865, partial [Bacteroides ovatus]